MSPLSFISRTISLDAGEVFRFSNGEYDSYTVEMYVALKDFELYDALKSFLQSTYQQDDGSYIINGITFGNSLRYDTVLESFLELVTQHQVQSQFTKYLIHMGYIMPLITKNIYLGDYDCFEMKEL